MNDRQPEAIRLAAICDLGHPLEDDVVLIGPELRRLHAELEGVKALHIEQAEALISQRDALRAQVERLQAAGQVVAPELIARVNGWRCSGDSEWARGVNSGIDAAVQITQAWGRTTQAVAASSPATAVDAVDLLQAGLSNDDLRAAFESKLPGVTPTERDLSIFAIGAEVGAGELAAERQSKRMYFEERNSARDAWRRAANDRDELRAALQASRPPVTQQAVAEGAGDVTDADIRRVFLANGFTVKEGQADLKPYVFQAARALLALATTKEQRS